MTKEEKLTEQVQQLKVSIAAFIEACPDFVGDTVQAKNIAVALANAETTLHWDFSCWELGLPCDELDKDI